MTDTPGNGRGERLGFRTWHDHQHYRPERGAPIWIKLYRRLLDDPEWRALTDSQARLVVELLLASSEQFGTLPANPNALAWRLGVSGEAAMAQLVADLAVLRARRWLVPVDQMEPAKPAPAKPARRKAKPAPEPEPEPDTDEDPKGRATAKVQAAFAEFWKAYPSRGGSSNPRKDALRWFAARVAEGVDPAVLTREAAAYAAWCDILGRTRGPLVMQAVRWLGENERGWEGNRWAIGWHLLKQARTDEERTAVEANLADWEARRGREEIAA